MNDEAFARRFYADRAELESLGIHLKVDKPAEGYYEAENYSLPPENFYLPAIEFTDKELGALRTSLSLLDGEFAYAEPLRLALQQLSWGKPSPLDAPEQRSVALAVTAGAGGRELSQRLSKVETAIFRRKTIVFDYYTIGRDAEEKRKVDPYHLLYRGGQFYLIGYSHERDDVRVFRVSRIRGKVGYSSKAEHDFNRPEDFDPRMYATRTDWQLGDPVGRARIWLSDRIDWLALRHFGHAGEVSDADGGVIFETDYANSRQMVSWVLGLGEQARIEGPDELVTEARERLDLVTERHAKPPELAKPARRRKQAEPEDDDEGRESPIRPERFARLVTLAGILIDAAREGRQARRRAALRVASGDRHRAAPGHRRAERRELRRRLLRALRRGPGRSDRGGPRAVRRQLRPPRAAAAARGEGARRRDRPDRRAPPGGLARVRSQEDRGCPRPGPGRGWPPDHHREGRRLRGRASGVRRDHRAAAPEDRVLQGERGRVHRAHARALQARERPGGLVHPRLGPGQGAAALVPARPRPPGGRARRDLRAAPRRGARRARLALDRRGRLRKYGTHLGLPRARALGTRGPSRCHRALRWRRDLRAHLRLVRVAGPRDPQGGGRRGRARAGGGARAVLEAAEQLAVTA